MTKSASVSVIIPALNEAPGIALTVREIPDWVGEIVVVDNGSSDDTARVAKNAGARVVFEPRRGYGTACQAGIRVARGDLLAFIDADYSDYPADLARVIAPVAAGDADLCIGARRPKPASILPFHQRFGNWLICHLISLRYRTRCTDLGPMRCIGRDALARLDMRDLDYGWTVEMQLKAVILGLRVVEIPVRYRARVGVSKISGTLRGSWGAAKKILYWFCKLCFRSPKPSPRSAEK